MKPIYVSVKDLDQNQRIIYDLKLDTNYIVQGCAGSGKTSLALLRMQQILASKNEEGKCPSFYYVAFVRELVECIRREMNQMTHVPNDRNDYPITYWNWEKKRITGFMSWNFKIKSDSEHRRPSSGRTPDIAVDSQPDYLLVDECQDLEIENILSLYRGARKGISFYGDDAQHIMQWERRNPVTLEMISDRIKIPIHQLIWNYRLPREIALFAEHLGGRSDLSRHCKSAYHEKPFMIKVNDVEDAINFMAKRIKNMRLSDVGIAFRTNQAVRVVTHQLREKRIDVSGSWSLNDEGNGRDEDWQYLNNTDVKVMTYEKIKGQQFETVFLYVDGELTPEMLKRFYVGVTRAERFLYILYKGSLPSVLRQIPLSLYEKSDVVKSKKTENPSGKDSGPSDGNTLSAADIGF